MTGSCHVCFVQYFVMSLCTEAVYHVVSVYHVLVLVAVLSNCCCQGLITHFALHCQRRLDRVAKSGPKRGLRKPTLDEIDQALVGNISLIQYSFFLYFVLLFVALLCFYFYIVYNFKRYKHITVKFFDTVHQATTERCIHPAKSPAPLITKMGSWG